jgi:hypothetical protein
MADTGEVMSWVSQNPLVDKEMESDKTMVYLLAISHREKYTYRINSAGLEKIFRRSLPERTGFPYLIWTPLSSHE